MHTWHYKRLLSQFDQGIISFQEYASNAILTMVGQAEKHMEELKASVDLIPTLLLERYVMFLRSTVVNENYEPCPRPFLVKFTEAEIEEKKKLLRPVYVRLIELVEERLKTDDC